MAGGTGDGKCQTCTWFCEGLSSQPRVMGRSMTPRPACQHAHFGNQDSA